MYSVLFVRLTRKVYLKNIGSVSYTHLDVYKRQLMERGHVVSEYEIHYQHESRILCENCDATCLLEWCCIKREVTGLQRPMIHDKTVWP